MSTPTPPGPRPSRERITEDALFVDPSLLGLPLARPSRRALAMAVDGLLIWMIAALIEAPSVFFGLAAALFLFRSLRARSVGAAPARRGGRVALRFGAAMVLFAVTISGWNEARDRFRQSVGDGLQFSIRSDGNAETKPEAEGTGMGAVRAAAAVLAFRQASDPAAARRHGERALGAVDSEADIAEMLTEVAASAPERPWLAALADSLVRERSAASPPRADPDSLLLAYASALQAGESASRPEVVTALAADTLAALGGTIRDLRREREELDARVSELEEAAEERGFIPIVTGLAEDLGLTFGWAGLYFTATLAMWRGQTPGKRMLGIRVVRLNGKPIGWWVAFERFGGYAAGFATGLLGFLQILWDGNRQGIHDKITETAVILDR